MQKPISFKPGSYSDVANRASPELVDMFLDVRARFGMAAFEMPKFDAAIHEAGHAIVYVVEGKIVHELSIFSRRYFGKQQWGGEVVGGMPWFADMRSPASDDLQRIRLFISGVAAEMVHHRGNHRKGSSLDEIDTAKKISSLAARKLGRDPVEVFAEQMAETQAILKRFWPEALQIAMVLERKTYVGGPKLAALLQPVREACR